MLHCVFCQEYPHHGHGQKDISLLTHNRNTCLERFEWLGLVLVPSNQKLPFVAYALLAPVDLDPIDAIVPKHWPSVV